MWSFVFVVKFDSAVKTSIEMVLKKRVESRDKQKMRKRVNERNGEVVEKKRNQMNEGFYKRV
jgi:hypothetical protein